MTTIQKLVLKNFKKFSEFEILFDDKRTVIVGDNESGKSSILLALDLVLSASRSKVESIGLDNLFNSDRVAEFLAGTKQYVDLPTIVAEVWLSPQPKEEFNGKINLAETLGDGIRMVCSPDDQLSQEVAQILASEEKNFPFEYYKIDFLTFRGDRFTSYTKPLVHLLIDNTRVDSDYAAREYIRSVFESHTEKKDRSKLENAYRQAKSEFGAVHLAEIRKEEGGGRFGLRTSNRANLNNDLAILEGSIPLESRGRGRQCFVKTDFALNRKAGKKGIEALLLEEPENHLSQGSMKMLIERIEAATRSQLIIATHSSLMSSRLDLRKAALLGTKPQKTAASLRQLTSDTAEFFMKAPDNNILAFVVAKRVILVEGDAEFILMDAFYKNYTKGKTTESEGIHVISVGGTAFKRYMELAELLDIKTAVIRDNDGDYGQNCVANYSEFNKPSTKIFADKDPKRDTFEICLYQDNSALCEELLAPDRRKLSVQEYMLKNKTDAAFELLQKRGEKLAVPSYIGEAITWIRS